MSRMSQLGVQTKKIVLASLAALFSTPIFIVVALAVIAMVSTVRWPVRNYCLPKIFSGPAARWWHYTVWNFEPRIFYARIILVFWTTCIGREMCSLVVLPILQCLNGQCLWFLVVIIYIYHTYPPKKAVMFSHLLVCLSFCPWTNYSKSCKKNCLKLGGWTSRTMANPSDFGIWIPRTNFSIFQNGAFLDIK